MPHAPLVCDDRPVSASLYESHVTVRCAGPDAPAATDGTSSTM
ncbi:hypothetical protein AB0K68_30855 [Streptomyces sp. NPDC050698]